MARNKRKPVTKVAVGDTGSAKLVTRQDGSLGVVYLRPVDGTTFQVRSTDKHSEIGGTLQALPNPIEYAYRRELLSEEQHRAAETYARDHAIAYSGGIKSSLYDDRGPSNPSENWRMSNRQAEALRSFAIASQLVLDRLGRPHRFIVDRVVLDEIPATRAALEWRMGGVGPDGERRPATPLAPRRGMAMLREALDVLDQHYFRYGG